MTQVKIPVEVTVKEAEKLNVAIAKELNLEDNKKLFEELISKAVELSGVS